MAKALDIFENIVRKTATPAYIATGQSYQRTTPAHPFESHNIHPKLPRKVRDLFDDGYCAEATFHAFKYSEKVLLKHATCSQSGRKLMIIAFNKDKPKIKLNTLSSTSELDEQEGFCFVFAGAMMAIRNPGGL